MLSPWWVAESIRRRLLEISFENGVRLIYTDDLDRLCAMASELEISGSDNSAFLTHLAALHGWHVLDLGSRGGACALTMGRWGARYVRAIEADIELAEALRENVRANGLEHRITVDSGNPRDIGNVLSRCSEQIDFLRIHPDWPVSEFLETGRDWFATQSPLIMFGGGHGKTFGEETIRHFGALGYSIYALIPGLKILLPVAPYVECQLNASFRNLFACKADRAEQLANGGWLLREDDGQEFTGELDERWCGQLLARPALSGAPASWLGFPTSTPYGKALLAWCGSCQNSLAAKLRVSLLRRAEEWAQEAFEARDCHPSVNALRVRVLTDLGRYSEAQAIASALLERVDDDGSFPLDRPVPPVWEFFDHCSPVRSLGAYFEESLLEFLIFQEALSSSFLVSREAGKRIDKALASREHSPRLERLAVLLCQRDKKLFERRGLIYLPCSDHYAAGWHEFCSARGFFDDPRDASWDSLVAQADDAIKAGWGESALILFQRALESDDVPVETTYSLALRLSELKYDDFAENALRKVIRDKPRHAGATAKLGAICLSRFELEEAETLLRRSLAEMSDCYEANRDLGNLLEKTNRLLEARYFFSRALDIRPDSAEALDRVGLILRRMGKYREAIPILVRASQLEETSVVTWHNLGICYLHTQDYALAEASFRKALDCNPQYFSSWSGLLLMCNYQDRDPEEVLGLHKNFGKIAAASREIVQHKNFPDPGRRIRVGLVSGDLRRHSVSYFVQSVFSGLDRGGFEIWVYYNYLGGDERTEEFRTLSYRWRDIHGNSDAEVIEQIRDDKIDVLFDLAGHTASNRLLVFAAKPAPVQVAWIGYPNTTGLDRIDYRLTDALVDPVGDADRHHTEHLWRLPASFLCYSPPPSAPAVVQPPCLSRGYITFGSFNSRAKLGSKCVALWARVVNAIPNSRLLIKSVYGLGEEEERNELHSLFVEAGIASDRIRIVGGIGLQEDHLALYSKIDIALDTFPYNGTTTTCEALWMGVPVITLTGDRHVSRVGMSLLTNAGLSDLIAESEDEFVEIATQLAADFDALAAIRNAFRQILKGTRLFDEVSMARDFGDALRGMWIKYCEAHPRVDQASSAHSDWVGDRRHPGQRLLIGGKERHDGWQLFTEDADGDADFHGNLGSLKRFGDTAYSEIYCCHVLQKLPQAEVVGYVCDLYRMLEPGGRLYLSVPDLDVLAWLLMSPAFGKAGKFQLMRMLFGQQLDIHDFNRIGLNEDFLRDYLQDSGFTSVERVESLRKFDDISELRIEGHCASVNLVAIK